MSDSAITMQRFAREATAKAAPAASSPPPEAEIVEDTHVSQAYGGLWSRRDRCHTIEFRPLDAMAGADSLEYGYLSRVQWNAAAGVIILRYQPLGVSVTIQGIGLFDLKEKLRQHLVTWIQELGNDPIRMQAARQEHGAEFIWVQRIRVEDLHPDG